MTERPESAVREPRLYVVATVHLDTQWRWTVRDTIRHFLPRTLRENFSLFDVFPAYVLSFEGAFRYMLVEEYYPRDFELLKGWIDAGRWRLAGTMIDSPDVNLVSPESLIRHILYANRYFLDRFGTTSTDIFLPDCFGFTYSLPTIAAHCGLSGFSTSKMIKWIAPAERPFDIGLWEGPDGGRLLAVLDPGGYGEPLREDLSRSERWQRRLRESAEKGLPQVGYRYFGVGDRGGSPDESSLYWLTRSVAPGKPLRVVHEGSDALYKDLDDEEMDLLPVHSGELLLPTHGTGCWTSQAVLKRWNRRNELLAESAEKAATIASWLAQFPYPTDQLRTDWIRFLWHQMHDDLTGTSIPEAYDITVNDHLLCLNRFATVLADALAAIARGLDTRSRGEALVVFNPLSCERRDALEATVEFSDGVPAALIVLDPEGREVSTQVLRRSDTTATIVFLPALAPLSVSVFRVCPGAPSTGASDLDIGTRHLESSRFRVELDDRGDISSILDRADGHNVLDQPARLELLRDHSPRWPAWEIRYADVAAEAVALGGDPTVEILEAGPARAALRVTRRFAGSTFRQTIRLSSDHSRVEIANQVDWATRSRLLKARFSLAASNPQATYDLGCGAIRRGNNTPEKYEVPAQQWADITSEDGSRGVSILSDSRYGWDKPDDSTLRLSLLRSPRTFRKFPHQATQDFGSHEFGFAVYPHAADWSVGGTVLEAARFNQPPPVFQATPHPGVLGRRLAFLDIDQPSVLLRSLKRAEERAEWVLRLQETTGSRAHVALALGEGIGSGHEVNGCEAPVGQAQVEDGKLHARLQPFQPKSFAVRISPPRQRIPPLSTVCVELPVDLEFASLHGSSRPVDFDGRGRSFPGELVPREVMSGETLFRFGRSATDAPRALACRGQTIELPEEPFDTLTLLATAAADQGLEATFDVDGAPSVILVDSWSRPVGGWWRRRRFLGRFFGRAAAPWTVRTPVAWLATHRHDRRVRDEPYTFCYLFRYDLALPRDAVRLTLPEVPRVVLFAATLSDLGGRRLRAAADLFS